jgi:hypothetical protein
MMGGWRPWQRWHPWQRWDRWLRRHPRTTARRLALYARRESGAPPPDLLRRLREDIPALPAMSYEPAAPGAERRGAPRRWLLAASLAAALTGGVLGLRVWQQRSRFAAEAASPAAAAGAPTATAALLEDSLGVKPKPRASVREVPAAPTAVPAPSPPPPPPVPAPVSVPAAAPPMAGAAGSAASSGAAAPRSRQSAGRLESLGYGGPPAGPARGGAVAPGGGVPPGKVAAGAGRAVPPAPSGAPGAESGALGQDGMVVTSEAPPPPAPPITDQQPLPNREMARSGAAAQRPPRPAPKAAGPEKAPAEEKAAAERPGRAVPQPQGAAAAAPTAKAASPLSPAPGAATRAQTPPASPAKPSGTAAPLRSSFGADTGIDSYRRLRRGLLDEGRLPRAASVRADELANAFELAGEVPAVRRPELSVEGAPLPAAGAIYLLRIEARGLMGPSRADAVEVDFDPAVVARFRRVGATAHRGGASALYEIELRPNAGRAPSAGRAGSAGIDAEAAPTGPPPVSPPAASGKQPAAALPRQAGDRPAATVVAPGYGGLDRVIATVRVAPRDRLADRVNVGGNEAGIESEYAGPNLPEAGRVLRLSQLHRSWEAASPALRAQGLAVQFAQALAAKDPAPPLRQLRVQARALAAELPDDPKAAELLDLVERAAELAAAGTGSGPP